MKFFKSIKIDKKSALFLGIGLGVLLVFVILIIILTLIFGGKLSFAKIEQKMITAAKSYYKANPDSLPVDGQEVYVDMGTLVEAEHMKPVEKYLKDKNTVCTGKVHVFNSNGHYGYFPFLDCGNDYTSTELFRKVSSEENIVEKGDGLYLVNKEYVFRGEVVKNYVKYGGRLFQIMKIAEDNSLKLLAVDFSSREVWDDRYNEEYNSMSGYNNFSISRIKDYLNELYDSSYFNDLERSYVVFKDLCIGKINDDETDRSGAKECAKLEERQPIGLIQTNEYVSASLDPECKKVSDVSCQNYNYLALYSKSWWTLNAKIGTTYKVYQVSASTLEAKTASGTSTVRPVLYLNGRTLFASGTGTAKDPYIIK